jgi:hypothetical protein
VYACVSTCYTHIEGERDLEIVHRAGEGIRTLTEGLYGISQLHHVLYEGKKNQNRRHKKKKRLQHKTMLKHVLSTSNKTELKHRALHHHPQFLGGKKKFTI